MKQIEMTGKTINEAIDNACAKLGVGLLDVEYKVIDEPTKGFLGIGSKPAKVLVTLIGSEDEDVKPEAKVEKPAVERKAEPKIENRAEFNTEKKPEPRNEKAVEKTEEKTAEAVVEEVEEANENESVRANLTDEDKNKILAVAANFLNEVFTKMNMSVELNAVFSDNKHIVIDMKGEDMGTIIGKRGQTLDSIQYLTNLVVNKGEYPYMNVTLDTEDYRAKRQKTLEQLAFNLAKKAKHNRRNITLEPMNPYERRIIHATLQNDRYVTTYSEGTEPFRYVVIALKNNYSSRRNYRNN
ncbi:MAG: RNA-binding cell elongation regulator Jag/EloR [Clostridia bacterium]|nr:RNA-binding cell elongation regulator Jag/EloR [Clostridia bacterium]